MQTATLVEVDLSGNPIPESLQPQLQVNNNSNIWNVLNLAQIECLAIKCTFHVLDYFASQPF